MAMTLRLTPEQDRALTLLAQSQSRSKHDAAVTAIVAACARALDDEIVHALAYETLADYRQQHARMHPTTPPPGATEPHN